MGPRFSTGMNTLLNTPSPQMGGFGFGPVYPTVHMQQPTQPYLILVFSDSYFFNKLVITPLLTTYPWAC